MLPDHPADQIRAMAASLNRAWREALGVRVPFPEVRPVMLELFRRGYHLGIASNTITSSEVPKMLKDLGIAGYFEGIALSCQVKSRKPAPDLLLAACAEMGVAPQRCAYIGNKPELDVPAAHRAGFACVVLLGNGANFSPEGRPADATITNLSELLSLFPTRPFLAESERYPQSVRASLSTSWAIGNFDRLEDFCESARRMGFAQIELNHQVTSAMLEGFQPHPGLVSSVHEPCPSQVPISVLAGRDWMISSEIEANRREAVAAIQRSIELAERLQARVVVVHCGNVQADNTMEKELVALYHAGLNHSPEADRLREVMRSQRQVKSGPRLAALIASVKELSDFAAPRGVCLGLENRDYFMQLPHPEELEILLSLAGPEQIGFVLDTGHAAHLDRLGLLPQRVWLERFGHRLVGMHLHDIQGLSDHRAPGQGDLDFSDFQQRVSGFGMKTLELEPDQSVSQVKSGLAYLLQKGLLTI
jgi:sugar phosphate isomerase/epimerase/beta-phosphoglucomutase-like phosphatase (HAD superfamily)